MGGLSTIATRRDLLIQVIPQSELNEWGVYEFRFYKNGQWVYVLIDDYLPTSKGKAVFSKCSNGNELWVPLVEKAYAKLHKCYENLEGGTVTYAMVDLTGGEQV